MSRFLGLFYGFWINLSSLSKQNLQYHKNDWGVGGWREEWMDGGREGGRE